jgi:Ca2+-binding RTX toxin-like protein
MPSTFGLLELLESRRHLSVSLSGDGVLSIEGTRRGDTILLAIYKQGRKAPLTVYDNGTTQTFDPADVKKIRINCGRGDDTVSFGHFIRGPLKDGSTFSFPVADFEESRLMPITAGASITCGDGADVITLGSGEGDDRVDGGAGDDLITTAGGDDRISGGAGDDRIVAGDGDDTIRGDEGNDSLNGDADDDLISGGADGDMLQGGSGKDTLQGDIGDECLVGGTESVLLQGGRGDDDIRGDTSADRVFGNAGNDRFYVSQDTAGERRDFNDAEDTLLNA